jgi:segregation and condensation protein B
MNRRRHHKRIAPPTPDRLPAVIESLLFVAGEPQEIGTLSKSLNIPRQGVERAVETLAASSDGRGLFVQRLGDRLQLATIPDAAPYIERFLEVEHGSLSRAALETLAIVAYRQPVTRAVIESVRGVNSDHAVATLLNRGLIEDVGRAPGPGRPVLFSTTIRFLEYFGLQRPDELPPLPEAEPVEGEEHSGAAAELTEALDGSGPTAEPAEGEEGSGTAAEPAEGEEDSGPTAEPAEGEEDSGPEAEPAEADEERA